MDLYLVFVYSIRMYFFNKIGRSELSKEFIISIEEVGEYFVLLFLFMVFGIRDIWVIFILFIGRGFVVRKGEEIF